MGEPVVGWRDKLALWCLRVLTPNGIIANNVPIVVSFGPGRSTPEDPKLVMYIEHKRRDGTRQPLCAPVFESPDAAIEIISEAAEFVRSWAAGGQTVSRD